MRQSVFPSHPVLLVDDEAEMLKSFEIALRSGGINNILKCQDSRDVRDILSKHDVELILLDLMMPFVSGQEILSFVNQEFPEICVIVITGSNDVEIAVECMKAGAFDYMVKPVEKSRLITGVKRIIERNELRYQNRLLKKYMLSGGLENPGAFSEIITNNKTMLKLFQYAESVAASPQPVMITGETGVGKELMSRAIHTLSAPEGPFVVVNAAGIDDNVFSDTLFGHVKGAFTGADEMRKGLVEKSCSGTLVLDEIGDLSPGSQIKLLRLVQDQEYFPLGSDLSKKSNARIIVLTNQDLQRLHESGRFRNDLFFRLNTHHIHIPPLRERPEDLQLLLDYFLEQVSGSLGKKTPTPPKELHVLLRNYYFPGNVRELRTMVYDAVSNHKSKKLSMERFKAHIDRARPFHYLNSVQKFQVDDSWFPSSVPLPTMAEANRLLIAEAMRRSNNNQSLAARLLGISRQRLIRNLKSNGNKGKADFSSPLSRNTSPDKHQGVY